MPAYQYKCDSCFKEWTEYHGLEEKATKCPFCEQENIKKVYNYVSSINRSQEQTSKNKTGTKTREFIEQARQDLKDHKASKK